MTFCDTVILLLALKGQTEERCDVLSLEMFQFSFFSQIEILIQYCVFDYRRPTFLEEKLEK